MIWNNWWFVKHGSWWHLFCMNNQIFCLTNRIPYLTCLRLWETPGRESTLSQRLGENFHKLPPPLWLSPSVAATNETHIYRVSGITTCWHLLRQARRLVSMNKYFRHGKLFILKKSQLISNRTKTKFCLIFFVFLINHKKGTTDIFCNYTWSSYR